MIAFLKRLFAPQGNLLTADIVLEINMVLLTSGYMKSTISKFQDDRNQSLSQAVIRMYVNALIEFAKEHRITIQWDKVAALHPPYEEHRQELEARHARAE